MDGSDWPRRWKEIEPIFERALEIPPANAGRYLDEACGGDTELRRAVEALLESARAESGPLDRGAGEYASSLLVGLADDAVGPEIGPSDVPQRLGPYRIGAEIGSGGMARVYEAERDDGVYRQRVALKLMRRRPEDADERRRRFEVEREVLAALDHPGIARILDGGETEDGRPYLVMERVDGVRLDEWRTQQEPTLEAILDLLTEICAAVHFAHQRLIVHRDLKPSNILVTAEGRPKLLDFGIAKLLEPEAGTSDELARTRTGLLLLTPDYAAPEQVRSAPVTTATDIYALGLLLYELLVGRRPFDLRGKTATEIERTICELEPERPSTAISRSRGGGSPPVHAVRFESDLDTIVMKALSKEPERRYRSAAELADDLDRYRSGRPVTARPPTARYRASRFARRHRLGVAMAAGIVALLTASAVLLALEQRRAARERDRARLEAAKAQQVTRFLIDLFQASDPQNALGVDLTARQLLETGRTQIAQMEGEPKVRAELSQAIGEVYQSLASFEEAEALLREALELRQDEGGGRTPEIASSLQALGELLRVRGSFEEAAERLEAALGLRRELAGAESAEVAQTLHSLGKLSRDKGDLDGALGRYRDSLDAQIRAGRERDPETGDVLSDLAVVQQEQGDYQGAEDSVRRALDVWRGLLGDGHPRIANSYNNLGLINSRAGDYETAERYYREALKRWDALVDEGHPERVGVLSNLAVLLHKKGDYPEAVELKREVLAQDRKAFGEAHPYVAMSLNSLGATVEMLGDWEEAETLKREAVDLYERLYQGGHPEFATALNNLAVLLEKKGELEEAEGLSRASLAMRRKVFPGSHPMVAEGLHNMGRLLWRRGKVAEGEDLLRQALAMDREVHNSAEGGEHPHVAASMTTLGRLLVATGRLEEGAPMLEDGLGMRRSLLGDEHPEVADSLEGMADLAHARGEVEAERSWLEQALALRMRTLGAEHPETLATSSQLDVLP